MNARYWPCLGVKLFAGAIRRTSDSAVRLCLEPRGGTDECTLPGGASHAERTELRSLLSGRKQEARKLKRAQILLAADAGASDEAIAASVGVGGSTVYRTKRRFAVAWSGLSRRAWLARCIARVYSFTPWSDQP